MAKRYQYVAIAAFACLITAALIGWFLHPKKPNLAGDSGYQGQQVSYQPGGLKCMPAVLNDVAIGKRQAEADACSETREQHRLAANSLLEARRSAIAADESAVAAYDQARSAAWGTALGVLTFLAAGVAVWYSKRAADASRKQLMLQFRPKLIAHQICVPLKQGSVRCSVNIVNEGAMDAIIESSGISAFVYKRHLPQTFPLTVDYSPNPALFKKIDKGQYEAWHFTTAPFTAREVTDIIKGRLHLYVMGRIRYRDEDGLTHRTLFCRKYDASTNRFSPDGLQDFEYES